MFTLQERCWEPINFKFAAHRRKFIYSHFAQNGFIVANNLDTMSEGFVALLDVILVNFHSFVGPCPKNAAEIINTLVSCGRLFCSYTLFRQETGFNAYNRFGRQLIAPKHFGSLLEDIALDILDIIREKRRHDLIKNIATIEAAELFLCNYNGVVAKIFWNVARAWMRQSSLYIPVANIKEWDLYVLNASNKLWAKYQHLK